MTYHCFNCQSELDARLVTTASRRDECPKCKADLLVCKNCKFYDPSAYNECREAQAERVTDKTKSNFCDYFTFSNATNSNQQHLKKEDYLKSLDALFK